jgi:hypothetical protein
MGMEQEILSPRVEDAEEPDLGAEMLGISCDLQQCRRTGAKQQRVEDLLVVQR